MIVHFLSVVFGLILLVWSADRFVEGSAVTAKYLGMPPILIGMIIVGFGTSAPEMLVSALSAAKGNPGIALGNAYGSNICNMALILGITALIKPIHVKSEILKKELPVLAMVTLMAILQLMDGVLTRIEAGILILCFTGLLAWSLFQKKMAASDTLAVEVENKLEHQSLSSRKAVAFVVMGFVLLIVSSQLLVTGSVEIAKFFGISDLMIGLTIVAVGTSLPELASSIMAARRNEHDIAIGNIIGSNLFNTMSVVGIAGLIHPMSIDPVFLSRDLPVMTGLTVSLFVIGYGFKGRLGRINRFEGLALLLSYFFYMGWLIVSQSTTV
ncbi:calcium/sodium antiporter [Desulfobacula sp.]|uniref:calcium/sodium antiporter n=1 Tax=Desulfobacula sp. TaxID=2593537 RepID=UPI0026374595|nr:calcium/sodium antiporter [Desulfobacula sp.]